MPDKPRAIVLGTKPTWWVMEHRAEIEQMAVVGWLPVVEGAEVIEAMKRRYGAENVVELETE